MLTVINSNSQTSKKGIQRGITKKSNIRDDAECKNKTTKKATLIIQKKQNRKKRTDETNVIFFFKLSPILLKFSIFFE